MSDNRISPTGLPTYSHGGPGRSDPTIFLTTDRTATAGRALYPVGPRPPGAPKLHADSRAMSYNRISPTGLPAYSHGGPGRSDPTIFQRRTAPVRPYPLTTTG